MSAGGKEAGPEKELLRTRSAAAAEQIAAGETAQQQQRGRTPLAQVINKPAALTAAPGLMILLCGLIITPLQQF